MFRGEYASLASIVATKAIKCPKPLGIFPVNDGSWALGMEHLRMDGTRDEKEFARCLAK